MGEEAGSEVGPEVDGMPLLGGKGGDGFGNSVPLFIAWDSSAMTGLLFLWAGLGGGMGGCLAGGAVVLAAVAAGSSRVLGAGAGATER